MADINKLHFANFFNIVTDPATEMINKELSLYNDPDDKVRLAWKDDTGAIKFLPGFDDFAALYDPNVVTVTQTSKDSLIGVGTEGDFSGIVTQNIPHSFIIQATGIHERQVLMQLSSTNVIKDVLVLPEFICKLDTYVDSFDVNTGILTEHIRKTKINIEPIKITLTNNAVFKTDVHALSTTIGSSFGYPVIAETNKDLVSSRNSIFIDADGYICVVTDKTVTSLPIPFTVFDKRPSPISVRIRTKYFLFDSGDKFKWKTYREYNDNALTDKYEFIKPEEAFEITEIVRADKVTDIRLSDERSILTLSPDKKTVTGLDVQFHYDIVVATNEIKDNPTLSYEILDMGNQFFNYIYKVIKYISDNTSSGFSGLVSGANQSRKFIFEYTYRAPSEVNGFTIPEDFFTPESGDKEYLFYKGLLLDKDVDYTRDTESNIVNLNFNLSKDETIDLVIFKYTEMSLVSTLQSRVNELTVKVDDVATSIETKADKTDVLYLNTLAGINNYTTIPTFTEGRLTQIEELDGTTVKKRTTLAYNPDGTINTVTDVYPTQTVISTMIYVNGQFSSVDKQLIEGGL